MDLALFEKRFTEACHRAHTFAKKFVVEDLPPTFKCHLVLNSSYDRHASDEFTLFPDDSSDAVAFQTKHLERDDVLNWLWRDGLVPQWVNVSVIGETEAETLIEVLACGRFIGDEEKLYHQPEELAPFHVLGPTLPPDYETGSRFSIHLRESCWRVEDLERADKFANEVRFLTLNSPTFSDGDCNLQEQFSKLSVLELNGTNVSTLSTIESLPALRYLRLRCGEIDCFGALPSEVQRAVG